MQEENEVAQGHGSQRSPSRRNRRSRLCPAIRFLLLAALLLAAPSSCFSAQALTPGLEPDAEGLRVDELRIVRPRVDLESRLCFRPLRGYNIETVSCTEQPPIMLIPGVDNYVDLVYSNHTDEPTRTLSVRFSWQGLDELSADCGAEEYEFDPDGRFEQVEVRECTGFSATLTLRSGLWVPVTGPLVAARLRFRPDSVGFGRLEIDGRESYRTAGPDPGSSPRNPASASIQVLRTLEILSTPSTLVSVGDRYRYGVNGCPAAKSTTDVSWSKTAGPGDLMVDPATGCIDWTPREPGVFAVGLQATDGRYTASQFFHVTVIAPRLQ